MTKKHHKDRVAAFAKSYTDQNNHLVSLEATIARYYASLSHLTLSILDDPNDAEDIVQETFIAASMKLSDFRGEADIKTWLYSIAINKSRGCLRKRNTRRTLTNVLQAIQSLTNRTPSPEDTAVQNERDDQLWQIVDSLDDKHRLPIILRYVHQLPITEIAKILELKEGTVHSRLFYAHQRIRGELKRMEFPTKDSREASG